MVSIYEGEYLKIKQNLGAYAIRKGNRLSATACSFLIQWKSHIRSEEICITT